MGKDPFTFLIEKKLSWRVKLSSYLYRCFRVYILRDKIPLRVWRKKDEDEIICQNMYRFISQNITMTEEIRFADLYLYSKKIDAVIVGSDQVWRYKYVANIEEYFLKSFVSGDLKRIAYAASFGVDKWEFPLRQTRRCAKLAHTFQAISVRESNGVEFCKQYMGVKAVHLLDPTMLLKQSAYINPDFFLYRKSNRIFCKKQEKLCRRLVSPLQSFFLTFFFYSMTRYIFTASSFLQDSRSATTSTRRLPLPN